MEVALAQDEQRVVHGTKRSSHRFIHVDDCLFSLLLLAWCWLVLPRLPLLNTPQAFPLLVFVRGRSR